MTGLSLAEGYYRDIGRPAIAERFPELMPRIAAGLCGEGSECLGFDDEQSRDHDFGPGFCLWLGAEDYARYGEALTELYESLPGEYGGFPARENTRRGGGRVGVFEIHAFYRRFIGNEQPPKDLMRWLYLPEDKLCAVTSGKVFEDGKGEFSGIREALLAYYPEDIRVKKIAARAARMAQSGQYNYPRCLNRGDTVAAELALSEFLTNAMQMIYLVNKRYAPYYKWLFRGLRDMKLLSGAIPLIEDIVRAGTEGEGPLRRVRRIEEICAMTAAELRREGLSEERDTFLEAHTWEIMSRIKDPVIRQCHVLEG